MYPRQLCHWARFHGPLQPMHRIKQDPPWKMDIPCYPSITDFPTGNGKRDPARNVPSPLFSSSGQESCTVDSDTAKCPPGLPDRGPMRGERGMIRKDLAGRSNVEPDCLERALHEDTPVARNSFGLPPGVCPCNPGGPPPRSGEWAPGTWGNPVPRRSRSGTSQGVIQVEAGGVIIASMPSCSSHTSDTALACSSYHERTGAEVFQEPGTGAYVGPCRYGG